MARCQIEQDNTTASRPNEDPTRGVARPTAHGRPRVLVWLPPGECPAVRCRLTAGAGRTGCVVGSSRAPGSVTSRGVLWAHFRRFSQPQSQLVNVFVCLVLAPYQTNDPVRPSRPVLVAVERCRWNCDEFPFDSFRTASSSAYTLVSH